MDNLEELLSGKYSYLKIARSAKNNKWSMAMCFKPKAPKEFNEKFHEIDSVTEVYSCIRTEDYPDCSIMLDSDSDCNNYISISKIEKTPNEKYEQQLKEYDEQIKIYNQELEIYNKLNEVLKDIENNFLKEIRRAQYEQLKKEFENA